ncbi:glycosyltransferase [Jatrophihabitans sp. YIM 134969]
MTATRTTTPTPVAPPVATALRLLTTEDVADRLRAEPVVTARSAVVVSRPDRIVRDALRLPADVVVLQAGGRLHARLAVSLRAAGVTVWWLDALGSRPPGVGAPALTSRWPDAAGLARVAELAGRPGVGLDDGPPVSVVVTALDEGHALDRIVTAVAAQLRVDDELVLVDGGSGDGSVERVTAATGDDPRIRVVVRNGAGISVGRNLGVRAARHDVIACTDAGCEPAPGWLDALRRAFAGPDRPGLVSGTYTPVANSAMTSAQAVSCYPDPHEVARPDLFVALYTRVLGTAFRPAFAVGRCVAFTRDAWTDAGGFPEHLPTGEDVSFGLAVARHHRCVGTSDADVSWAQRDDLRGTWRMYQSYGRASTDGGDARLLLRDGVRGLAYLVGAVAALSGHGRTGVAVGALAYLSLPVRRARRAGVAARVYPLLPLALATKDLAKLSGALQGFARSRRRR